MRRFALLWLAPVAVIVAVAVAPLATGARTLFVRDVLNTHLALRAHLATSLRAGELPLIDPLRGGGQGLLGNPNAVPLYPDNLLLLVASPLWQLNAHFWLHALVALAAMYWLGRVWGLAREGAWAAAVVYAGSGYFLSQMNLYNAVAGAALAPALAAALLASGRETRRRRMLAALGALWALALLAGDPLLAAIGLAVAIGLALLDRRPLRWRGMALAVGLGSLVAAPQYVEMLRLLPGSFRGFWGNAAAAMVKATPDPRALLDLLLPLFFGRPDTIGGWSEPLFGGAPPLYYSLAPGVIALAAMVAGARAGDRRTPALVVVIGAAVVLAYSRPWAGEVLSRLPGGGLLRFPVKLVLGAAVASSLLAGLGLERVASGARAACLRALGLLAAIQLALLALFLAPGNLLEAPFRALFVAGVGDDLWRLLRPGWVGTAGLQLLLALAAFGLLAGLRRRPATAAALLVAGHAASQLVLLAGLVPTDAAAVYRRPPAVLDAIPRTAVIAHGGALGTFVDGYPAERPLPDRRSYRLWRRAQREAFGFPGLLDGRRYEFVVSPEGLDSFLVQAIAVGMSSFDDGRRLAVLSATGVDRLLLPRPLDLSALGRARLDSRTDGPSPLFVYRVEPALADAQLLGEARFAPHVQAGLTEVFAAGFDPRRVAVIAGEGAPLSGPTGAVRIERFAAERIELEADSEAGGFVVVRRAWLPIWRAEIDGVAARPRIANLTRLAVEVPPGRHRVELYVSRAPFRLSLLAALLGGVGLVALGRRE